MIQITKEIGEGIFSNWAFMHGENKDPRIFMTQFLRSVVLIKFNNLKSIKT